MTVDVVMPKMGESIQEGKILKWLKKPGDAVKRDDVLFEISTDKVDTEVPSSTDGILTTIIFPEGATVAVGTVVAAISTDMNAAVIPTPAPHAPAAPKAAPAPAAAPAPVAAVPAAAAPAPAAPSGTRIDIVMPKMGESIQEGKILKWAKQAGDKIERDDVLFEISTDKVDTEVPSPAAGTLTEILFPEGATVAVGTVVAYLGTSSGAPAKAAAAAAPVAAPSNGATAARPAPAPAMAAQPAVTGSTPPQHISGKRFFSPVVRTIAKQENISQEELDTIPGSGLDGRVTKNDLLAYMQNRSARPAARVAVCAPRIEIPKGTPAFIAGEDVEIVPMDNIRALISEHMTRSKHTSAHVTGVHECDFTKIEKYRAAHKDEFKKREGMSLTPTPFIAHAVVQTLREFPYVNASIDGTNIIVKKHINLGMATALPDGNLIVPVIKDADNLTITGMARAINDMATRARNKKLKPEEIQGGTFTITNFGIFGSLFGTPIINQPQVAILGMGVIQKRPVVRQLDGDDYIVIRSMGYLSLSHDHRLVDGMIAGMFMSKLTARLEAFDPDTVTL